MKKGKFFNLFLTVLIGILSVFTVSLSVYAEAIGDIRIIKIAPQDQRAVIKTDERELKIITVGDVLHVTDHELRVVEIVTGRVVFEEKTDKGVEEVIIRLENGKQREERIKRAGEPQPKLYAPASVPEIENKGN